MLTGMMIFLLIFLANVRIAISLNTTDLQLGFIGRCSSTRNNHVIKDDELLREINLQNEEEISDHGHFSGFVPESYILHLSFENKTHYGGHELVRVKTVQETKYLIFNIGRQSPEIDVDTIRIRRRHASQVGSGVCVANIAAVPSQEILVITFNTTLPANSSYSVTFVTIKSKVFDESSNEGAKGLRSSLIDGSLALYTLFYMRAARTVFPCVDHPSLKATFQLCLNVPRRFNPVTNTDIAFPLSKAKTRHLQYCFKRTPVIATHSFGFVLTKNYVTTVSKKGDLMVAVPKLHPTKRSLLVLRAAKKAVRYMTNITNFSLPSTLTKFVVVRLPTVKRMTTFQLILLDLTLMDLSERRLLTSEVLYQTIIHQWIGNIVTIKNWKDACLPESLSIYLSWLFLPPAIRGKIQVLAKKHIRELIGEDYNFGVKRNISDLEQLRLCAKQPPLILHMLTERLGTRIIKNFTAMLVQNYPMASAGMIEWEKTLSTVTGNISFTRSFLSRWFYQPGPVTLEIRRQNNSVTIRQNINDKVLFNPYVSFRVHCSTDAKPSRFTFGDENQIKFGVNPDAQWCLVDPDSQTLTRKVYETDVYLTIIGGQHEDPHTHLTAARFDDFIYDICNALLADQLLLDNDSYKDRWINILNIVERLTMPGSVCNCCVTRSILQIMACSHIASQCNDLKIIKLTKFERTVQPAFCNVSKITTPLNSDPMFLCEFSLIYGKATV